MAVLDQEPERIRHVYTAYAQGRMAESKWSPKNPGNAAILSEPV